jgi:hypothetical protein
MTVELLFTYSTRVASGSFKSECRAASIEGDGGLRSEYADGFFGSYARTRRIGSARSVDGPVKLWSVSGFLKGLS